jgi:hypothetical protein
MQTKCALVPVERPPKVGKMSTPGRGACFNRLFYLVAYYQSGSFLSFAVFWKPCEARRIVFKRLASSPDTAINVLREHLLVETKLELVTEPHPTRVLASQAPFAPQVQRAAVA